MKRKSAIMIFCFLIFLAAFAPHRHTSAQTVKAGDVIEITLETGDGFCADCERVATLRANGAAGFHGGKNSRVRKGDFAGKISQPEFARLAKIIIKAGFFNFKSLYKGKTADAAGAKITVIYLNQTKTVENFGASDNPFLKTVEQAIETAISKIEWQKVN